MEINLANVVIKFTFFADDLEWLQRNGIKIPPFWTGHPIPPTAGDMLRIAGHLFAVTSRVWEHDGKRPHLQLYLGRRQAPEGVTLQ